MKKVVLELDEKLREGEILQYKNGKLISVEIHELLPDLIEAKKIISIQKGEIQELRNKVCILINQVKELRGED